MLPQGWHSKALSTTNETELFFKWEPDDNLEFFFLLFIWEAEIQERVLYFLVLDFPRCLQEPLRQEEARERRTQHTGRQQEATSCLPGVRTRSQQVSQEQNAGTLIRNAGTPRGSQCAARPNVYLQTFQNFNFSMKPASMLSLIQHIKSNEFHP